MNLLYVCIVLDLTKKMKYVNFCLRSLYGSTKASEISRNIENAMHDMCNFYEKSCDNVTEEVIAAINVMEFGNREVVDVGYV